MPLTEVAELLMARAPDHGFALAGVLDIQVAMTAFEPHFARYEQWLDAGLAGRMRYLNRSRGRRADPRSLFPEAKSILCVGLPYGPGNDPPEEGEERFSQARYAAYLRGRDYHQVAAYRLEALLAEVSRVHPFRWKIFCDSSALLERSWAALAGLGWIGKNTCLIHPRLGSMFFCAEALLDVSTGGTPKPMPDHCGSCDTCLEGCPTQAFPEAHVLNARRCIAYWTLERRGGLRLAPEDLRAVGNRVAGCDICQDLCPYNRKAHASGLPEWEDASADATKLVEWAELVAEGPLAYRDRVRQSALSFVRREHFQRNLALALASVFSRLDDEHRRALIPALKKRAGDPDFRAALGAGVSF